MAIINGNHLLIFIDNVAIGCTTNCTLTSTKETIDVTCKDNNGARQVLSGSQSWNITADGLWDFASTLGPQGLYATHFNGTRVGIKMAITDENGTEQSGKSYFQGYALLNNYTIAGPQNAGSTFALTFEGDGPLSIGTTT
jgi:predicted secreted protein